MLDRSEATNEEWMICWSRIPDAPGPYFLLYSTYSYLPHVCALCLLQHGKSNDPKTNLPRCFCCAILDARAGLVLVGPWAGPSVPVSLCLASLAGGRAVRSRFSVLGTWLTACQTGLFLTAALPWESFWREMQPYALNRPAGPL